MFETISQTLVFGGYFLILGAALGLLYEFFRFIRLLIRHNTLAVTVEDCLFASVSAIVSFIVALSVGGGYFRLYYVFFEAIGFILYHFTLGKLIYLISKHTIVLLRRILRRFFAFTHKYLRRFFVFIRQKFKLQFVIIYNFLTKPIVLSKKLLQKRYSLVYNNKRSNNVEGSENKNAVKARIITKKT